jgi:hypothetical protein
MWIRDRKKIRIRWKKSRIRDKHPGSATLTARELKTLAAKEDPEVKLEYRILINHMTDGTRLNHCFSEILYIKVDLLVY